MTLSGEVLFSEERIRVRVEDLAAAIAADTPDGETISAIVIMDGAYAFASDLLRRIPHPVRIAFVAVPSVDRGGDPRSVALPAGFPVEGRDVLVIEDILDTGKTLSALVSRLAALRPGRIRVAVLLDKPARRAAEFRADYVGFEVGDDWLVGYGLDDDGLHRNLPYLTRTI